MVLMNLLKSARALFYGVGPEEMAENAKENHVPDYLLHAIPVFLVMIAIEFVIGLARGQKLYRANDTISSILLGSLQTLMGYWFQFVNIALFAYIYEHFHFVDLDPARWTTWILSLLGVELGYYWLHRTAHEYHVLWIGHSVHHSGEDYNLATALRQGVLQMTYSFIFMLPNALFVPPLIYAHHRALNTLFQFWIHTSVIGSLGPLEYIFNTASHHRMHHRPPGNCNYGGVLIIYDRMFGTFVAEDEQKDIYGLAKQYSTFDPVWANVEHGRRMLENIGNGKTRSWGFYLALLTKRRVKHKKVFRVSGLWQPLPSPKRSLWAKPVSNTRTRYDGDESAQRLSLKIYAMFLVVGAILLTVISLVFASSMTTIDAIGVQLVGIFLYAAIGRLLDGLSPFSINLNTARVLIFLCISSWLRTISVSDYRFDIIFQYAQYFTSIDALLWFLVLRFVKQDFPKIKL